MITYEDCVRMAGELADALEEAAGDAAGEREQWMLNLAARLRLPIQPATSMKEVLSRLRAENSPFPSHEDQDIIAANLATATPDQLAAAECVHEIGLSLRRWELAAHAAGQPRPVFSRSVVTSAAPIIHGASALIAGDTRDMRGSAYDSGRKAD